MRRIRGPLRIAVLSTIFNLQPRAIWAGAKLCHPRPGHAFTSSGEDHAFIYRNGEMTDLGTLGRAPSYAQGVNNEAQAIGYSSNQNGAFRGFLWSNGTMQGLGSLGGDRSVATAINESGMITGTPIGRRCQRTGLRGGPFLPSLHHAIRRNQAALESAW